MYLDAATKIEAKGEKKNENEKDKKKKETNVLHCR